jgi:hypothetical protein
MRSQIPSFRLCVLIVFSILFLAAVSHAQDKPKSPSGETVASKPQVPAAKQQATPAASVENGEDLDKSRAAEADRDGAEQVRKRDEWFYKQRSSVNGHIPAGARVKAFQHMQRMMVAEGKLVLRPDGSYAEATPQSLLSPLSAVTSAWASIGPTPTTGGFFSPVTGRITTIAVDPFDASGNTLLIGGAMGGIWRSADAGATWTAVGDQNASLAMGSIAFAPSNHSVVYAGTGESESVSFDIYYGAGVLKSTDGGLHWTQTCTVASSTCPFIGPYSDVTPFGFFTLGGTRITYVAVNPSNAQMVLVGAQTQFSQGPTEGVYCSDDGGSTWSNILPDQLSSFVGFASSSVAYAALGNPFGSSPNAPNGNGIYKATSIGSTCATVHFSRLTSTTLPPQSSMGRIDLGIAPSDTTGSTVYASIADASIDPNTGFRQASETNLGVFVTTNGGTSWTQTSAPDICQHQCWYDNVIKVDPNNQSIAFFGGAAVRDSSRNFSWVVRTENGGTTWSSVIPNLPGGSAGLPHVDNHAIAFIKLPTGKVRLYLGNDGGIWRTDDAEASTITWINLNNPSLTLTQFYPSISINASSPSFSFGGTQDNASQNYQGGTSWIDNQLCGDGASTAVDSVIPSTVYIGCATGFPVNASYQNGAIGTFSPAINGINLSDFSSFIPPLATDPNAADVLYFGTTKVYQSVDAGNTWTPISSDLVFGPHGDWINTIAVEPGNSKVVYVGANNGLIFASTDVTPGLPCCPGFIQLNNVGLPPRAVTAIAVDPSDSTGRTAYVTFSGFSFVNTSFGVNDPIGHIFKTTDEGATWKDVSCSVAVCTTPAASDLPNTPVNDLVIDPDLPGIIYAATDEGVFVGDCTASPCKWSVLSTGLPHVVVLSLRLHEASRTLRAATHGRGAWDIFLNNFSFTGPRIFSLSPTSANSGGAALTLTVNGTGLTGGTIQFNGTPLATTAVQADTQLTAQVSTALLVAGTPKVTVKVGTTTSNSLTFSVLAAVPTLTAVTPSSTPVQAPPGTPVQIQLTGTNFSSNVKVLFNGAQSGITVAAPTASCPLLTCLPATLPAALLTGYGSTDSISVLNMPPGGGQSKSLTFQIVAPPPPNDNFANAINISTLSFNDFQDTSGATTESTDPIPSCVTQFTAAQGNSGGHPNGAYNSIWYKFTPPFSANLFVETSFTTYDAVLSMWTGTQGNLTQVACNDDIHQGVNVVSQLSNVPLIAGSTYYIMVSSFGPPDPNPIALGGRSDIVFSYNNGLYPTPTISSLSPASAKSGDPTFTLTVNGSGFLNGAFIVLWDPSYQATPLATTFVSSAQVTAIVPASAILFPGNYQILANNPQPSNWSSVPFTVNVGTYPVPALSSIYPTGVIAGGLFSIQINAYGTNFAQNAALNFGAVAGSSPQVFGHTSLSATVPASALATSGMVQITVSNPTPGGGPSNSLPFAITAPNPLPTITSLSPAGAQAGTSTTVTVTGTGFLSGAEVCLNLSYGLSCGGASFLSSTQLSISVGLPSSPGTIAFYVVDPAPGGTSAPFNFIVTGPPDFSITSSGTTTQTITAGQTATFTNAISIAAQNGFSAQVNLSCTLPFNATATTCSVAPNSFASGSGTATVTVTTMARGVVPPLWPRIRFISRPQFMPILLLMILMSALLLRFARTRRQRFAGALPLAIFVILLTMEAIGCGSGGGYNPPPPPTGTPAGTYTVTVTATSGSLTHTTTLTLVVQ